MTGKRPIRQAARIAGRLRCQAANAALCAAILGICFLASGASAQYTVVGGAPATVPDEDVMRKNLEEARWSAGPLRVQPWLGLRDLSYVRQQQNASGEGAQDQFTVTVGAGVRAYAPLGPRVIWAAHLLPEYVWWQDDTSKDGLNGRFGMGVFAYANRVDLHLFHRIQEQQDFFSEEVQELTTTATATSQIGAEVKLLRGVHAYGSWDRVDFEGNDDDSILFTQLDRVEDSWSAGLRLRSHRGWSLGVGVRHTEGDFEPGARNLSFESDAVTLDLRAEVGRFILSLDLEDADIEPQPGSLIEPRQQTFGDLEFAWQVRRQVTFQAYAERQRTFSVVATRSLIVRDEQGVRTAFSGNAWDLLLLVGSGSLESDQVGTAADVTDDYDVYGATLGFRLGRLGSVQLNAIQRNYDVGILGDRDVTSYGISVQLTGLAKRLSIGEGRSDW